MSANHTDSDGDGPDSGSGNVTFNGEDVELFKRSTLNFFYVVAAIVVVIACALLYRTLRTRRQRLKDELEAGVEIDRSLDALHRQEHTVL